MESTYRNRRVMVTGHTGFCGSWLSQWLRQLGADVYGFAKPPITTPNLFNEIGEWDSTHTEFGDISTPGALRESFSRTEPEIVFHLAAQPLVRQSYYDPIETYRTNVLGTAELMEAIKATDSVSAAVLITTDKVYHNMEWIHPYRETDRLGGKDPYSASKAACELVIASYRNTILDENRVLCASARGGNIIGGGDWSNDRLIPDIVRAVTEDECLTLRNPDATRPWQHVLALCHGYLALGVELFAGKKEFAGSWNFGPIDNAALAAIEITNLFSQLWRPVEMRVEGSALVEAQRLALDSSKALHELKWRPSWSTHESVDQTVRWYKEFYEKQDMRIFTKHQIDEYSSKITAA